MIILYILILNKFSTNEYKTEYVIMTHQTLSLNVPITLNKKRRKWRSHLFLFLFFIFLHEILDIDKIDSTEEAKGIWF